MFSHLRAHRIAHTTRPDYRDSMAYFIGNGAATIGGGSLGRTEQLPTLKLLCVDLCARYDEALWLLFESLSTSSHNP